MKASRVLSYGGGVQSAAIAVLIVQGRLPTPDCVVMADTGIEASETWEYMDATVRPLLRRVGLEVSIAPPSLATVGLFSKSGKPLIPAFTSDGGKLPNYCSVEWKRRVVQRWLRANGHTDVELWLGISRDEVERAKDSPVRWMTHRYPLLMDVPMSRAECIALVTGHGLPQPPRSSCFGCPFRTNLEWKHLKERNDGDWEKAVALDESLPEGLYVHRSGTPLAKANLGEAQGELDFCESGYCWT